MLKFTFSLSLRESSWDSEEPVEKKRGIKCVGIIVAELMVLIVNPHLVNQEAKS